MSEEMEERTVGDEVDEMLLEPGFPPLRCTCHMGSVCGEACRRGVCHGGCYRPPIQGAF